MLPALSARAREPARSRPPRTARSRARRSRPSGACTDLTPGRCKLEVPMSPLRLSFAALAVAALSANSATIPSVRPEDAGMSAERLGRVHEAMQRHIDAREISGAVTLVARRGRIVHFQAHGLMDIESKRP